MTVKIEFTTDNDDFAGNNFPSAVAYALRHLADLIEEQSRSFLAGNGSRERISDRNGNTIGYCTFEIDAIDEEIAEEAVRDLDREQCVYLLEQFAYIQTYDYESLEVLRSAVAESLQAGDIYLDQLEA